MKKATVVVTVVLLCMALPVLAMATKPAGGVSSDSLTLKFIEPMEQNVQINCAGFDGRIYFIDSILLSKHDILDKKVCFILNNDFIYTDLTANGQEIPLLEYRSVKGSDFSPAIGKSVFNTLKDKCTVYELGFNRVSDLPDTVRIRFKYHLVGLEAQHTYIVKKDLVQMTGDYYWYPRNPNLDAKIGLLVKSTDKYTFSLNGVAMNYSMKQIYTKEYLTEFVDSKSNPAVIIFQRKS